MARMKLYDKDRIAHRLLEYKDIQFLRNYKSERGWQGHGRRLHVWRLEWRLSTFFYHRGFKESTMDQASWASISEEYAVSVCL